MNAAPTHYARDDDWQPICGGGQEGDLMTFFLDQTTCAQCRSVLALPVSQE